MISSHSIAEQFSEYKFYENIMNVSIDIGFTVAGTDVLYPGFFGSDSDHPGCVINGSNVRFISYYTMSDTNEIVLSNSSCMRSIFNLTHSQTLQYDTSTDHIQLLLTIHDVWSIPFGIFPGFGYFSFADSEIDVRALLNHSTPNVKTITLLSTLRNDTCTHE